MAGDLRRLRGVGDKKTSLTTSFMLAWTDYFSGLQVNYRKTTKADDLILIFSAMTTDKLQNNYRITSDPFSEPFVHPTPLPVLHWALMLWGPLWRNNRKQRWTWLNSSRISLCSCWRSLTSLISMLRPTFVRNSTMMRSIFSVHCPRDWMNYRMVTDGQSVY